MKDCKAIVVKEPGNVRHEGKKTLQAKWSYQFKKDLLKMKKQNNLAPWRAH